MTVSFRPGGVMKLMNTLLEGHSPTAKFLLDEVVASSDPQSVKEGETFTVSLELFVDGERRVLEYTFPGPFEIQPAPLLPPEVEPPAMDCHGLLWRAKAALLAQLDQLRGGGLLR